MPIDAIVGQDGTSARAGVTSMAKDTLTAVDRAAVAVLDVADDYEERERYVMSVGLPSENVRSQRVIEYTNAANAALVPTPPIRSCRRRQSPSVGVAHVHNDGARNIIYDKLAAL